MKDKSTIMSTEKNNKNNELYKDVETDGITKNVAEEQTIQTEETKILKTKDGKNGTEVLIGKNIEEVDKIEESHESLQKKILNKLMR